MILQSNDDFDEFAVINDNTGKMSFFSKAQSPHLVSSNTQGFYSIIEGKMISFYRKGEGLHLKIEDQDFSITDRTSSQFAKRDDQHIFKLLDGSKLLVSFSYKSPELIVPLEIDPTPFVEYEDFDFLYFVHNVLGDDERRQRIYQ